MRNIAFSGLVLLIALNTGCAITNAPPNEVADNFWQALVSEDLSTAQSLATTQSKSLVALPELYWREAQVSFGEIRIRAADADVDTMIKLTSHKDPTRKPFAFKTYLEKEADRWRIDYAKTRNSFKLAQQSGLEGLASELQGLTNKLSEKMGETLQGLKKELPKVEKQVEELGGKINDDVQNAIEQLGPAIKQRLDEFAGALEGALGKPPSKHQSHRDSDVENAI